MNLASLVRACLGPLLGAAVALTALAPRVQAQSPDALARLLYESDSLRVRVRAAEVLGSLAPSPEVTEGLIRALSDRDAAVRCASASSLGRAAVCSDGAAPSALARLAADPDDAVRAAAAAASTTLAARCPTRGSPPSGRGWTSPPTEFYLDWTIDVDDGAAGLRVTAEAAVLCRADDSMVATLTSAATLPGEHDPSHASSAIGAVVEGVLRLARRAFPSGDLEIEPPGAPGLPPRRTPGPRIWLCGPDGCGSPPDP